MPRKQDWMWRTAGRKSLISYQLTDFRLLGKLKYICRYKLVLSSRRVLIKQIVARCTNANELSPDRKFLSLHRWLKNTICNHNIYYQLLSRHCIRDISISDRNWNSRKVYWYVDWFFVCTVTQVVMLIV